MILALLVALQTPVSVHDSTIRAAVRFVAEREPVEGFDTASGLIEVRGIALLDADRDGTPEAFVWIEPRFRQTPTILAYRYDQGQGVSRILEALVPGSPQAISGRFVDDHTLGFGVDIGFGLEKQPSIEFLAANGVRNHMSVVRYSTFAHIDGRRSFVSVADLSNWKFQTPDTKTCEDFEFSPVEGLVAGRLGGGDQRYLAALTSSEITIYEFHGLRSSGLFDKQSWLRSRPPGVVGLAQSADGTVQLRMSDGRLTSLARP